jgi:hypothetical protein
MAIYEAMPWSDGEHRMHELMRVPEYENPTSPFLTPQAAFGLQTHPLLAIGTTDSQGRPWVTVWGGRPGLSQALGNDIAGTRTIVDAEHDPVIQAMASQSFGRTSEMKKGMLFAGLTIDLETRKRVKIAGRVIAGALTKLDDGDGTELQLATKIEESLGTFLHDAESLAQLLTTRKAIVPNISTRRTCSL